MSTQSAKPTAAPEECYRCGYDLHGIADERPCPECGLPAGRSRRETDELHHTRPRWLSRLSTGMWLLIVCLLLMAGWSLYFNDAWQSVGGWLYMHHGRLSEREQTFVVAVPQIGYVVICLLMVASLWLLTVPEGYVDADTADRRLRLTIRVISLLLPVELLIQIATGTYLAYNPYHGLEIDQLIWVIVLLITSAVLTNLLFLRLRGLGRRARSARLVEHCAIVGAGSAMAILYLAAILVIVHFAESLHLGTYWFVRSTWSLLLMALSGALALLFLFWSLYLVSRFALAFRAAAYALNRTWRAEDRRLQAK